MLYLFFVISLTVQENVAQKNLSDLNMENYTTCDKFVENMTSFDFKSVVDIDWKIFYFWNPNFEESYNIKFSLPSQELIKRFRVELEGEIKPPVNWTEAVLFMESTIDFSALVVLTNKTGIFRLIPSVSFEYPDTPLIKIGMKVVQPGYLGIVNCLYRVCYALAPINHMPHHDYLTEEAQKLGFWSDFGRTHTSMHPPLSKLPPEPYQTDDDGEDENLEIIHQHEDALQFL